MTDEEMAEEYEENAECIEIDDYGHKVYGCLEIEQAFLAGLRASRLKWHKVADGDLPKESISVLIFSPDDFVDDCIYIPGEGFKHPVFNNWYRPVAWIEKEKILPKKEVK